MCVAGAGAFGYMMAYLKIPSMVLELAAPIAHSQLGVLTFIVVLYIILGTFMDGAPAIVIFISIVQGLAAAVGLNQVHVGVLVIVTLCFGFVTPPYGLTLLLSAGIAGIPPSSLIRSLAPIYLVLLAVLLLLVFFPDIVLFLPRLLVPASVG
jgi:TRAP-type C4-dicarboxylate transport system permease large subunit